MENKKRKRYEHFELEGDYSDFDAKNPNKRSRKRSENFELESDCFDFDTKNPNKRSRKHFPSLTTPTPKRPKRIPKTRTPKSHVETPSLLSCREKEVADILQFIKGKLIDGGGGCMYISGVPGTGKTATIIEIARILREAADEGQIPSFKFVEVNGLRLTEPHHAYVTILKALTGQKATPNHAANLLDAYFSKPRPTHTLLLADELDLLCTRSQSVLYNLLNWPSRQSARLIVLAVANTMDLPERIMDNKISSRLGLTRLTFMPYTFRQLQEIVNSRIKMFEPDAVQLAVRKVAALSGDVRRALGICRRAASREGSGCGQPKRGRGPVRLAEVEAVAKEMLSTPKIQAIKHASVHEKLFLRALLAELARTGLEEAPLACITHQLHTLCRAEGVRPVGHTQLSLLCSRLCSSRLLLIDTRRKWERKVRPNISTDDLIFALKE